MQQTSTCILTNREASSPSIRPASFFFGMRNNKTIEAHSQQSCLSSRALAPRMCVYSTGRRGREIPHAFLCKNRGVFRTLRTSVVLSKCPYVHDHNCNCSYVIPSWGNNLCSIYSNPIEKFIRCACRLELSSCIFIGITITVYFSFN